MNFYAFFGHPEPPPQRTCRSWSPRSPWFERFGSSRQPRAPPLPPALFGALGAMGRGPPRVSIPPPPAVQDPLSENHRMSGVGRDLCGSSSPTPCRSRVTYSRLHRTLSRQGLNISREEIFALQHPGKPPVSAASPPHALSFHTCPESASSEPGRESCRALSCLCKG